MEIGESSFYESLGGKNRAEVSRLLCWKGELLPLQHLRDVEIEEVAVQNGLDTASKDRNQVVEPFEVVSVCPVKDVQSSVGPQSEQVMRGDGFRLSGLADHEELRQNRNGLQVDGEGPQDLHGVEGMIEHQRNQGGRDQQEFYSECVMIAIISGLELDEHEINCSEGGGEKENLHDGVVNRHEVRQQIQISRHKDERKQDLRLAGDSGTRPSLPYLPHEKGQRQKMR